MASVRLQPPPPFNFKQPDDWPRWWKRFQQFRLASALDQESEERQISTLLYCLGEDAEQVLSSTPISADNKKKYAEVAAAFEGFFKVRKNVIFERARFNRRTQQDGESVEQFITSLYTLAEDCDYGELKSIHSDLQFNTSIDNKEQLLINYINFRHKQSQLGC